MNEAAGGKSPKAGRKRAVEMAGLWKEWKAKRQASHSSHEPLGNLANSGARFPHFHSSGDDGGWKRAKPEAGFSRSHRHGSSFSQNKKNGRGTGFALRPAAGAPRPA